MSTDDLMGLEDDVLEPSKRRTRSGGLLSGLAILLALGAAALSVWLWWQERDLEPGANLQLQARLDSQEQAQSRQAADLAALQSSVEATVQRAPNTQSLESELAEHQARSRSLEQDLEAQASYARTLQQAIESMQARLTAVESGLAVQAPVRLDAPMQLDLAGVEYLLRLAPERLVLFHDVRSADQALELADARLEGLDNPMHIALRQGIADARQALADTTLPDPVEISARLDSLQARLVGLGFADGQEETAGADTPAADAAAEDPGWWERLKVSLAGLVTVRRDADDTTSRLTFDDKDMLRQGLWMQVEAARLALMRHDQSAWADAFARASRVQQRWFDRSSEAYRAVHEEIEALSGLNIDPELPDISGPWAQLQIIRQVRGAPSPVEQEPEPAPQGASHEDADAAAGQPNADETAADDSG